MAQKTSWLQKIINPQKRKRKGKERHFHSLPQKELSRSYSLHPESSSSSRESNSMCQMWQMYKDLLEEDNFFYQGKKLVIDLQQLLNGSWLHLVQVPTRKRIGVVVPDSKLVRLANLFQLNLSMRTKSWEGVKSISCLPLRNLPLSNMRQWISCSFQADALLHENQKTTLVVWVSGFLKRSISSKCPDHVLWKRSGQSWSKRDC